MPYAEIGKNIRKYRKQQGLTQEQLAEMSNLSTNYVGAIERGEKTLTLKTLIGIVDALNITADLLLCDSIQNGYRIKSSIITEKLEKLPASERNKILKMIDIMLEEK